jgi:DNA-binding LytR/AlgR family response regulator
MIRCMIIDDEPLAQEVLAAHISRFGQLEVVASAANAIEAFRLLHQIPVDLLFLDIRMPSISGIDFLKSLKNPPQVIFTTAYTEYAHAGFELDAVDYLVKPVSYERFEKAMKKLLRIMPAPEEPEKDYTYFKVSGRLLKVAHADLLYVQSVRDYLQLHTVNGNLLTHMTMKSLAELLPAKHFVRVHRSYLVNLKHIDKVERNAIFIKGMEIPLGENYRDGLGSIWREWG